MTLATHPSSGTATAARTASIVIPNDRNVAACAAAESRRYSMALARLTFSQNGKVAYVTCTDGRCMTRAQVESGTAPDNAGDVYYLPPSILKRSTGKTPQIVTIVGDAATRPAKGGDTMTRLQPASEVNFPPTEDIWPTVDAVAKGTAVTINAELLARMADAIGNAGAVTLIIQGSATKPVIVVGDNGAGLLMTCGHGRDDNHADRYRGHVFASMPKGGA